MRYYLDTIIPDPRLQLNRFIRIMRRALPWQLLALWLLFRRFLCGWSRSLSLLDHLGALGSSTFPATAFPSLGALTFGLYTFERSVDFRL